MVQGPLLFIQFLTGDNFKSGSIFSFAIQYSSDSKYFITYLSFPIFMGISLLVLFCAFLLRVSYLTIKANGMTTKYEIAQTFKRVGIFICTILLLSLLLALLFFLMDQINVALNKTLQPLTADKLKAHSFSDYIYRTLFNNALEWSEVTKANNQHYFVAEHFSIIDGSKNGNALNFIIIILFVLTVVGFLFWMLFTVFQKILEILWLAFSLPFAMSFSLSETTDMRWKIWTNEIFNKIIIFISLMVLYRLFVYIFIDAYNMVWNSKVGFLNPRLNILYIMFVIVMATGSSILFLNKFIAKRNLEHLGILKAIKSFQQTRDFIETYRHQNVFYFNQTVALEPLNTINDNVMELKQSIKNTPITTSLQNNGIEKVKIFN